jgi:hypothetical protein
MQSVTTRRGCDAVPTRSAHGQQWISRLLSGPTGSVVPEPSSGSNRATSLRTLRRTTTRADSSTSGIHPADLAQRIGRRQCGGGRRCGDLGRMPADARDAALDWRKTVPLIVVGSGRSVC